MLFEDYLNDCLYGGKSIKVISGLTYFSFLKFDHYRLVN